MVRKSKLTLGNGVHTRGRFTRTSRSACTDAKRLSQAIRERQIDFEVHQCTRIQGRDHEDLVHIADILSNMSKLSVECAEIL